VSQRRLEARRRRPRLGQHFLRSPAILDRIAREAARAAAGCGFVVEIGAGPGPLTRRLLDSGLRVAAIEIDSRLVSRLRQNCPEAEVVEADVLEVDWAKLIPSQAVVAGNLPYYISSPILRRLCDASARIREAILLLQKEVAARVAARPGGRDFGYLSALCQCNARPEILFPVPPGAFRPAPRVFSAVVRLVMEPRLERWGIGDRDAFLRFVELCFHQKRKTLLNNLQSHPARSVLAGLPEARLRAEQLSPEQLAALWRRLENPHPV
jgi:16S rRNA (adenine1518-N6/adenine1519-N6)-dimethyltransferase